MKLNFSQKDMDTATFPFSYVRTLMVAPTGGAEINECLLAGERIKENDTESWVREWVTAAAQAAQKAEQAMQAGQGITARQAYLRASNYYRSATFYLSHRDDRLDQYLALTRDTFQEAARLFTPPIEVIKIPFGDAQLPAYFLSAGQANRPTLIAVNGADSSNEELVHWIGFAAAARGWNFLAFEGPGQWSALQMNPGLYLRPDYEAPVKAVVDYLLTRTEVDPDKIALIGYSLGGTLAARVAAYEQRINATICVGIVVDVNDAMIADMPGWLQKSPDFIFDSLFGLVEKFSKRNAALLSHFMWIFGVSRFREVIEAWRPFNIAGLAPRIQKPLLLITGEQEYMQVKAKVILDNMRFLRDIPGPVSMHQFDFSEGWAGSHCQVGALSQIQAVVFDWLDHTVVKKDLSWNADSKADFHVIQKYLPRNAEINELQKSMQIREV
jgi:pimeloyl-ACP methyl ester carboxylesterase